MARKKSPEDQEWEHIFSAISFDSEPDPKYIKEATVRTKTGKRFKLSGYEFANVMEQERSMDPEHAIVESCKVVLDFEKLKTDINKFALGALKRAGQKHSKSSRQTRTNTKLRKVARKPPTTNN